MSTTCLGYLTVARSALFIVLLFVPAPHASERVTVSTYDDRSVGWDTGRLAVADEKGREMLVLEFRGVRRQSLSMFRVDTPLFAIDLSNLVRPLRNPFPTRTAVVVTAKSEDGTPTELGLVLPFQSRTDAPCESLVVQLSRDRVVESRITSAASGSCVL